jgi:hypothetical protein
MLNRYTDETIFDTERQQLERLDKLNQNVKQQFFIPTLEGYENKFWPDTSSHGQIVRDIDHHGHLWTNNEPYELRIDQEFDYENQQPELWHPVGYARCRVDIAGSDFSASGGPTQFFHFDKFYTLDNGTFKWDPPDTIRIRAGGMYATTYSIIFDSVSPNDDDSECHVTLSGLRQDGQVYSRHHKSLRGAVGGTIHWSVGNDVLDTWVDGLPHKLGVFISSIGYPPPNTINSTTVGISGTGGRPQGTYMEVTRLGGAIMTDMYHQSWANRENPFEHTDVIVGP